MMSTTGRDQFGNTAAILKPAPLLMRFSKVLKEAFPVGPVLDLACGSGHNGLYLASLGASAILVDWDDERLASARARADDLGLSAGFQRVNLESSVPPRLPEAAYGIILVFRYLHRPLIPIVKKTLKPGGILVYETFTVEQRKYGKPRNPDHLLNPGELNGWFDNWEVIHDHEGDLEHPKRAVAQIVCRKPEFAH